uniref:Uncharacterized protein n=3 Tax=Avena sativa TaxID=4498 RepID=A0ACD6A0Y0_AVESA
MPRRTEDAAFAKPVEPEECLEFDDHEEEIEEEEIEYEEIEEEVEEVEEVEEDEDILEEVEESSEEEEEDPEEREVDDSDSKLEVVPQQDDAKDGIDKEKHAELLALPPHGSEVYVGSISSGASSEDLKKLCESVGEVAEVKIMKGYALVTFRTNDLALKAIKKLNNATFEGKKIKVSSSPAKNKLFVGNVPHSWAHDDLKKAVEEVGPGVLKVTLIKDPRTDRNRGYGFVEYYNSACAEYSRQKMSTPNFKLDTNSPTISWADVKNSDSASASSASKVTSVYVKNLPKNVTEEQLEKLFEHHGEITKVFLPPSKSGHTNRYGFVHFKNRHMAMKALEQTEKYELDGQLLDCSLAKPPAEKKDKTVSVPSAKGGPLLHAPLGYGMTPRADAYGAPPAYGASPAYGAQPLLYAPGAPPGAAMVPMLLPDGRLVYVVQHPSVQQHYASPPPQARHHQHFTSPSSQARHHQHFTSPSSQARHGGRHGGGSGGGGSGGSSRIGSGAKRPRGDDSSSRNKGRQRR